MVPRVVLMKSGLVSVNTARRVNVAHTKTTVNAARPMSYLFKKSTFNWPKASIFNAARPKAVINAVKGNNVNAVKASACWVWKPKTKVLDYVSKYNSGNPQMDLQDQGVINSGCSRHMTGNMPYLTDYEEIDGGYVAFGGNPKGGKITGKVTIKTGSGPDWLFNIDALTRTMNYEPIVAGTQSNGFVDPKSFRDDGSKPLSDDGNKVDEDSRKDSEGIDQEKEDNVNNTNNVNAASTNEVNAVGGKTSIELPLDPNMPELEDYSIFEDDEDVDHPLDHVIGDLQSATQTRRMSKSLEEHGEEPKKIEEEVYVCQLLGFKDLDFPDRVYKVEKALYGLHQALRAWFETLSTNLLDNGFQRGKIDKMLIPT
ncbi:putative ribonuclease H-like domain-containing protein [Tanacetum coccineum]